HSHRIAWMKRSAEQSPSVSLFPFLAVLLCTMGALVVVLVVINRQARFKAAAAVSEAAEHNTEELQVAEEQLRLQLSQLSTARDATLEDLAEARSRLSGIEDHLRRARNQIQELQSAARQLPDSDAQARANKDALRSELARLRQQQQ